MSLIVYPNEDYNSWTSIDECYDYFANKIRSATWDSYDDTTREKALMQAFVRINLLNLVYTIPIDDTVLADLKKAQMEQAVHELRYDLDVTASSLTAVDLDGVKVNWKESQIKPYPPIVLDFLRKYLKLKTVSAHR